MATTTPSQIEGLENQTKEFVQLSFGYSYIYKFQPHVGYRQLGNKPTKTKNVMVNPTQNTTYFSWMGTQYYHPMSHKSSTGYSQHSTNA